MVEGPRRRPCAVRPAAAATPSTNSAMPTRRGRQAGECTRAEKSLNGAMGTQHHQWTNNIQGRRLGTPLTPGLARAAPPVWQETAHAPAANAVMRRMQRDLATGAPQLMRDMAIVDDKLADFQCTPPHHGRNAGRVTATTTCGAGTGETGTATQGTEHAHGHQIFVRVQAGRTITLWVRSWNDSVHDVRERIHNKVRNPAHQHRLIFAGKQLTRGHHTLADYGLERGPLWNSSAACVAECQQKATKALTPPLRGVARMCRTWTSGRSTSRNT